MARIKKPRGRKTVSPHRRKPTVSFEEMAATPDPVIALVKKGDKEIPSAMRLPPPPSQLRGIALQEWKRVVALFESIGGLTGFDYMTLAMYCVTAAEFWESFDEMEKAKRRKGGVCGGRLVEGKGQPYRSPWFDIHISAKRDLYKYSALFGLSPQDRRLNGVAGAGNPVPARNPNETSFDDFA